MDAMTNAAGRFGRVILSAFAVQNVVNFGKELARTQREFDSINAIFHSVEGSAGAAEAAFDGVKEMSKTLGLDLRSTAKSFAQFNAAAKGSALEGDAARDIFESVSIAATALQLDAHSTRGAMRALEQMISKGNVQAEELRGQLGERLPGAFQRAARAMGFTTSQLNDMLENGEVLAEDLLPKLAASLREDYTAGAQLGAQSLSSDINRLNTAIDETKVALSELLLVEDQTEALETGFSGLAGALEWLISKRSQFTDFAQAITLADAQADLAATTARLNGAREALERLRRVGIGRRKITMREKVIEWWEQKVRDLEARIVAAGAVLDARRPADDSPEVAAPKFEEILIPDEVLKNAEERSKRLEQFTQDLARSLEALRSPTEVLNDQIAKYVVGLKVGAITQEQFNALVLAARDNFLESSPVMQAAIEEQERLAEAQRESAAAQQDAFELFSDLDPFVAYANAVRELTDAFNLLTPEQIAALGGAERVQEVLDENIAKLGERLSDVQETGDLFSGLEEGLAGAITRGVTDGADGALDAFTQLLQKMAVEALQSQLSDVLSDVIGSLGGIIGGAAGATSKSAKKIPGKAVGGTVTGGKTYLVGERGPELFTAGRTGTITPNNAMGGGLTYAPVVTIQGGATEQDRILFQRQLDQQKAEIFDLARRGRL
ncbi:MAG: tape measure protein [Pseudomonadales bacterium]